MQLLLLYGMHVTFHVSTDNGVFVKVFFERFVYINFMLCLKKCSVIVEEKKSLHIKFLFLEDYPKHTDIVYA